MPDKVDDPHMTQIDGVPDRKVIERHRGMAYFPNTGPFATTCGTCVWRGYYRQSDRWNERQQKWVSKPQKVQGCAKFRALTGRHGPDVNANWPSCKYYDDGKPK